MLPLQGPEGRVRMVGTARAAQDLVDELLDQADEHKKLEARSRALVKRTYATIAEVEALCSELEINVVRTPKEARHG